MLVYWKVIATTPIVHLTFIMFLSLRRDLFFHMSTWTPQGVQFTTIPLGNWRNCWVNGPTAGLLEQWENKTLVIHHHPMIFAWFSGCGGSWKSRNCEFYQPCFKTPDGIYLLRVHQLGSPFAKKYALKSSWESSCNHHQFYRFEKQQSKKTKWET